MQCARVREAGGERALWEQHRELERGSAIRIYEGARFTSR